MLSIKKFNKKVADRGKEIFNENGVKSIYKFNGIYYGKVVGSSEKYYYININNKTGSCNCDYYGNYLCKHLYAFNQKIKNTNNLVDYYKQLEQLSKQRLLDILNTYIKQNPSIVNIICNELDKPDIKLKNNKYLELLKNIQENTNDILYTKLEFTDEELDFYDLEESLDKLLKTIKKDKITQDDEILNYLKEFSNKINNEYTCDSFSDIIDYFRRDQ